MVTKGLVINQGSTPLSWLADSWGKLKFLLGFSDDEGMNIKGLGGANLSQPPLNPVNKIDPSIKSDMTHDRDANGRQDPSDKKQDQKQRQMTPEEFDKSLNHLRLLAVVKEHKWVIEEETVDGKRFVLVKDNLGTVIRRIPELDLWTLNLSDEVIGKGHLLHKAA